MALTDEKVKAAKSNPTVSINFEVNGVRHALVIEPRETLLEVLRNRLGLMGTKLSCDVQVCGVCTVLLDGMPVSACTVLAYEARGREVLTIEGLAQGEELHPIQEAFIEGRGFQCGFCTPGMILATKALLAENPDPSIDDIKGYMKGNLCRCTGYRTILDSIQIASRRLRQEHP